MKVTKANDDKGYKLRFEHEKYALEIEVDEAGMMEAQFKLAFEFMRDGEYRNASSLTAWLQAYQQYGFLMMYVRMFETRCGGLEYGEQAEMLKVVREMVSELSDNNWEQQDVPEESPTIALWY